MSFTEKSSNNCLLSYGITTNPDPIQASPETGNPSITSIVVTVSNSSTKAIYCNKITLSFLIGSNAQDLTTDSSEILVAANNSDKWQISMTSAGVFTATPIAPNDNEITTDGLSFQIFNITTNVQVGTFEFYIEENSSLDNSNFTNKNNTYELTKFPYGFYVNNFAASEPMVNDGNAVTLTWIGSDLAAYHIFYGTTSVDVTNERSWASPGLTETTTFALKATVQDLGETVETYLYVTVIVANAEITATTLKVLQTSNLAGATSIGSTLGVAGDTSLVNAAISGTLGVTGDTSLANTAASGTLGVTGDTTLNNLTANGNLTVSGSTQLSTAQVNGDITVNGSVGMMTSASLLASGTIIDQTAVLAKTDGFVMAYITRPEKVTKMSNAFASVNSSGNWFQMLGGSVGTFGHNWQDYMVTNFNTMCIPVGKGTTFYYLGTQLSDNQQDSPIYFYWYPIGVDSSSQSTYEVLKKGQYEEPPSPPVPEQRIVDIQNKRLNKVNDFISALEKAFDKSIAIEQKKVLSNLILEM